MSNFDQQLNVGPFGHEGFRQLRTNVTGSLLLKRPAFSLLIILLRK